jgi:hypothetical protein
MKNIQVRLVLQLFWKRLRSREIARNKPLRPALIEGLDTAEIYERESRKILRAASTKRNENAATTARHN